MLRWWSINLTKGLGKYLNCTSSAWKKFKFTGHIRWDEVLRAFTWEYVFQWKYPKTMSGVKEDVYVMAAIYFIQMEINCTWWI